MNRIRQWLHEKTAPADDGPDVDIDYVTDGIRYRYLSMPVRGQQVRCDLCGKLYEPGELPEAFDHLDRHDEQGAAEVDPFELGPVQSNTLDPDRVEAFIPSSDGTEAKSREVATQRTPREAFEKKPEIDPARFFE